MNRFAGAVALGFALFSATLGVAQLDAQAPTASVFGTVSDASGALVADAALQIKNTGTGIVRNATSDSQRRYRLTDLLIGSYQRQRPGFRRGFPTPGAFSQGANITSNPNPAAGQITTIVGTSRQMQFGLGILF